MKRFDWDIFCSIIDNFGDIGVCWRLARQLSVERNQRVRLWVDDWDVTSRLLPEIAPQFPCCSVSGVEICFWSDSIPEVTPARSVIEAFACELPDSYIRKLNESKVAHDWFNLEYLSAEDWVEGCHGLTSTHPASGLRKQFFFPGFSVKTGGLIKEAGLFSDIEHFRLGAGKERKFDQMGVTSRSESERFFSLFCYDTPRATDWLDVLKQSKLPHTVFIPSGRIWAVIEPWLMRQGINAPQDLEVIDIGLLRLLRVPFMPQTDYDQLLWSCDLNAVRGEDSFVRGQFAGAPIVWNIYAQSDNAHADKLEAYLSKSATPEALARWMRWWNDLEDGNPLDLWLAVEQSWASLQQHAQNWALHLDQLPSLALTLLKQRQETSGHPADDLKHGADFGKDLV